VSTEAPDPDALRGSWAAVSLLFVSQVSLSVLGIGLVKHWGEGARASLAGKDFSAPAVWWTTVGASAYLVSFLLWMLLLTRAPLSVVYPLSVGATLCLTLGLGVAIFHERPSLVQLIGASLILLGVGLIGSGLSR
jgi:drug/metabolite transporter (DMT)-like permease